MPDDRSALRKPTAKCAAWSDPEPRRVDTQAGEKAGASGASAGLLRGWSDGVRADWQLTELGVECVVIAPTLVR